MGKTTLLRCIAGQESVDSGTVTFTSGLRMGFLEQSPQLDENLTVTEACLQADSAVTQAIRTYEEALASGDDARIAAASEAMDAANAWDYEDRLRQMLSQLGITDLNKPVGQLSGGQRKRVALAKVILEEPQLVLLDEPTNHLDIESIEWLESFLQRSRVALLMVTHDRYFLDRVCTRIIEIDRSQIFSYEGNYDNYLRRRRERIEAMTAELAKVKNTLRREQEWMNRQPQARAGKAKFRIDNFYDLKQRAAIDLRQRNVSLNVKSSYIGSKIFEASHVSKRFGDKIILDDFNYIFSRYEKVGIIGHNGVGKSTFIKMLLGEVATDSGTWDIGTTVRFGYYRQDGMHFSPDKKVIEAITDVADDIVLNGGELRLNPSQFLQQFLFTPADQQKLIAKLSGGERSRLYLASVLLGSPNFLILDEPTNDLDIVTLGILEEYLADFEGCVIVVSHDRYFLDNIVDHLFVLPRRRIGKKIFRATIPTTASGSNNRMRKKKALEAERAAKRTDNADTKPQSTRERPARLTFKERKEFEQLEAELEALNAEKRCARRIVQQR